AAEAFDEARVGGELGHQLLDRDRAVEAAVTGQVHLGHPAACEPLMDLVAVPEDPWFLLSHGAASVESPTRRIVSWARSARHPERLVQDGLGDGTGGRSAGGGADAGKVLDD